MKVMRRATCSPVVKSARRKAGVILRFCAALVLAFQIAYTPLHLYSVHHVEDIDGGAMTDWSAGIALADDPGHDRDGHNDHSAAQHKLKALRSERAAHAEIVLVPMAEWVQTDQQRPPEEAFEFSGLSPPEYCASWQFFFRAALPVRAPSSVS